DRAAAAIVGRQDVLAGLINDKMAWARADRRGVVEVLQFAGRGVEREGADGAPLLPLGLVDFIDRIDELAAGMNRQERRTGDLRRERRLGQLAARKVQLQAIDALAASSAGVGADIDPELVRFLVRANRREEGADDSEREHRPKQMNHGCDSW